MSIYTPVSRKRHFARVFSHFVLKWKKIRIVQSPPNRGAYFSVRVVYIYTHIYLVYIHTHIGAYIHVYTYSFRCLDLGIGINAGVFVGLCESSGILTRVTTSLVRCVLLSLNQCARFIDLKLGIRVNPSIFVGLLLIPGKKFSKVSTLSVDTKWLHIVVMLKHSKASTLECSHVETLNYQRPDWGVYW